MPDVVVRMNEDQAIRLRFLDVGDGTHAMPVTQAATLGPAAGGAGTDRSVTATTTSQQFMAANTARRMFYLKNDAAVDVWINPSATAVATAGGGNIKIPAGGGYFDIAGATGAWSIIAASATAAITAREF